MEEERTQLEETVETVAQPSEEVITSSAQESKHNDINIRQLREEKEKAQRERDDLLRRLQEIEQKKQQQPIEEETVLNPDDLVEWRHVQKRFKNMEDQLKSYQQQSTLSSTEIALKNKFNDFDQVVTYENIEILRTLEPEIAESISSNQNLYNKGAAAYKAIKRLLEEKDTLNKEKAVQNMQKPRPSNTASPQYGDSPLSKANSFGKRMTEERRKEVYQEMKRILGKS